ncbi:MAG: VWA domain-containing protein [Isosphaeraceae bacterium]|nr:VWA domain-containing protein [Isosphaeraceae bacterium]
MNGRRLLTLLFASPFLGGTVDAQSLPAHPWSAHVVVPQARSYAPGRSQALQITGVNVGVVIRDQVASTMMEVRLRNPGSLRQQAELLVPVPDGAVVRGFAFEGPSAEPSARLLPRDEARETYDRIVAQARDPALLEFAGFNLVRSSVFPVEPGGTQAVRLTYEHLLTANGDRVDYVLPRSESVEYNVPWNVAVKISSPSPIAAIYSPSHRLRTTRPQPKTAAVELAEGAGSEPGPFRLSLLREQADISASLFAYPDPKVGGGYFLLLAGLPPRSARSEVPALRREVTLVIDHSGSMRGEKLDQVREAALQVLAGLDEGERFNVILYNEAVEPFATRPVRKSRETVRDATEFLQGMTARGGTNIHDALLEALRQPSAEGTLPIVLFMTDGLPTIGQTSEAAIREMARKGNPHERRIFTFGVGVDVNTPLLEKVAYESRATTTFILPAEDVEVKVAAVFRRLQGPVLANPVLSEGEGGTRRRTRELIPGRIRDVFEGDQIVVLGQYSGSEPLEFTLRGNYRGTPRAFSFRLSLDQATTRNGFVSRLWASRKIGLLVDAIREQGGAPGVVSRESKASTSVVTRELVDEVVRLSTEFGILTEYTAFLAHEGTDFSQKDKIRVEAENFFRDRAIQTRSGISAANQDLNNQYQKSMACVNPRNRYWDATMNEVATATVQQVCDLAFYKRREGWVDSRLVVTEAEVRPEKVITFGSEEFRALAAKLAAEGRQGSIALRGDILMLIDGRPVLIKAPAVEP